MVNRTLAGIVILCVATLLSAQNALPSLHEQLYAAHVAGYANGWDAGDHLRAGNLWRDAGDYERALPHWQASFALTPDAQLGSALIAVLLARGDFDEALRIVQLTQPLAPGSTYLNATLGFLLAPSDPQGALPWLRVVAADDQWGAAALPLYGLASVPPPEPQYSVRVGAILANQGYYALAENAYAYAAARNYPFPEAIAQIGYMRDLQGKPSARWMQEAVSLAPDSADVRFTQGLHLRANDQPDLAVEAFLMALQLRPDDAVVLHEIAQTYAQMGLTDQAATWQTRADAASTPKITNEISN